MSLVTAIEGTVLSIDQLDSKDESETRRGIVISHRIKKENVHS